jgi:hypothetical protein
MYVARLDGSPELDAFPFTNRAISALIGLKLRPFVTKGRTAAPNKGGRQGN